MTKENMQLQIIEQREVLGKDFTVYGTFEEPLFLAKDVAEWIEHSNSRMMLNSVDDEEKVVSNAYTLGGVQEQWFLTEDGLYEVLMQSRKPIAKAFKKEVKKILKALRTGAYRLTPYQSTKEEIELFEATSRVLKLNDNSKLLCVHNIYENNGLRHDYLPQYTEIFY